MKSRMFGSRAEKREKFTNGTDVPGDDEKTLQPHKNKPSFFGLFSPDNKTMSSEPPTEKDYEGVRMNVVRSQADSEGLPCVPEAVLQNTFNSIIGGKNVDKTLQYLKVQNMAVRGIIQPYDSNVTMKGAKNRQGVSCYLDALLFAMFAKLNAFEYMLQGQPEDENKRNLAIYLRAWVNMLRSGTLIDTDLTALIQDSLAKCGWPEANLVKQQDTSEAFSFITETLELPLLRLQVDLYHPAQNDEADHRFVEERLLNIAVPSVEDGKPIRLESCLMEYFNSRVEVQRQDPENDKKSQPEVRITPVNDEADAGGVASDKADVTTIGYKSDEDADRVPSPAPLSRVRSSDSTMRSRVEKHSAPMRRSFTLPTSESSIPRRRSLSLIQRVKVTEDGKVTPAPVSKDLSSVRDSDPDDKNFTNVITIPAWQVFRWIPWYAPDKQEPMSDDDVIRNFNQRPVIGICLKRYKYHEDGTISKVHTEVDIPDSLRLPHIITEGSDSLNDSSSLSTEYKLVLQSVVSHQGRRFDEGHYVSFARVAPKILTENRRHESDPPPDYEEAQWVKFDDLKPAGKKVVPVDNIKEALKAETPYMLFYQIVPVMDDNEPTTSNSVLPPSYRESKPKLIVTPCGTSSDPYNRIMVSSDPPEQPKPTKSANRIGSCCTPGADYFPVFSKLGDTMDTDFHNPTNVAPSPRASSEESSRAARPSLDVPTDKSTRTSGQFSEASRPATSSQIDSGINTERGSSGRFGFGRAVVRFSRSASRHSRSSSHSTSLVDDNHSPGPFSSDNRKSISLSNLTRSFGAKDVGKDKTSDVPLPVSGSDSCAAHVSVAEPQSRTPRPSEQRDVPASDASKDSTGTTTTDAVNGSVGTENGEADQASPDNTEAEASTTKRRKRRGKKKADGQDDDRQCVVM
ncbi:hypothetical protein TD95_002139 [Thielaviopsis punctulata]|uniref:ubiquitinyl hydrolase 1 n=1 Tax=Thielaviopsis punctulata TaxID=72032 RepID=A0A0F4ZAN4_9PEZI|nr:hypothetical protein TD95_002139 [Thielaviopsis punctulata]